MPRGAMATEDEIVAEVVAVLMEEHGGVKIPDGSVPKMAAALVKNLAAGPDMLAGLGSEILVQVFADADPKAKSYMQAVVLKWAKAF